MKRSFSVAVLTVALLLSLIAVSKRATAGSAGAGEPSLQQLEEVSKPPTCHLCAHCIPPAPDFGCCAANCTNGDCPAGLPHNDNCR